ncbi:MAG: CHASE domain-containing protein [Polaromonas sp.]|uniref:CHASE domain-containing protein n=1 Tax=Polaromonas sp. TaxID=1869339 RepID=UPI0027370D9C|nr:CHASE domain-containing protein [Polaromonas sp.]MDP3795896.1 CHASE domain-containing protein [Polaromonas sp.]
MPHAVRTLLHPLQGRLATWSLRQPGRFARKRVLPAARYRAIAWPLLTVGLLLAATVLMWRSAVTETEQIAHERFDFKVAEARFAIEQRLLAYEQVQRGGVALFAASNEVTRDQWRTYVRELNLEKNYPGIQAMAFSRRLLPAELNEFVQRTRSEGLAEYAVRPPGEREEYVPVSYIEPFDWRNRRALGFDLLSEPTRREALLRSRDTALPSATGKIKLAQETNEAVQSGFLLCMPVFPRGDVPLTIEGRRATLVGQACSVFRMNDLMRGILGPEKLPNIHLQVFDGSAVSADKLMYDSRQESSATPPESAAFATDQAFEFDGRVWTLRFKTLPAFDATIDVQKPRLILSVGLLVSLLFAAVVWSQSLNRRRARDLADANDGLQAEIAERTKLEAQLQQAKNVAEAANQAKSEFLAGVSHELRTPLTLILAPLEQLLRADPSAVGQRAQLERAQRNALLLLNRVNDILDFSKSEAGKFQVHWEAVDLVELVSGLAGDAAVVAEGKPCSLTWRVDPALDKVCLDRQHFEKIVLNFLSNALKFTPAGGCIRVEATCVNDDCFEFAVTDSGIGIPADKIPLLFERFQQIDSSATRRYGGTGIGLALAKGLVELMGGSVGVHSEPGRGSRFWARLPRGVDRLARLGADASASAERARSATEAMLLRVRYRGDGPESTPANSGTAAERALMPKVLVADDNPDMRTYLAELLEAEFDVLTAADGEQAWTLLQQHAIDVVVSDIMMPALDGLGLTARIKASPELNHVPVILVTARGGNEASVAGLETGADDYIAKPFSPAELRARVRAALRMGRTQAQLREKAYESGMAMIAMGILHNVGNVLTGITVSSSLIHDKLRQFPLGKLRKVAQLMQEQHAHDPSAPGASEARVRALPEFVARLSELLEAGQKAVLKEVENLRVCVQHASTVIATQQALARPGAQLRKLVSANGLMESALKLNRPTFEVPGIELHQDYAYMGAVSVEQHKVQQVLSNLLLNAAQALRNSSRADKQLWLSTARVEGWVRLTVRDNGEGIDPQQLPLVFSHGFTTKRDGHGFGLHLSANWAREVGGSLTGSSDGRGHGASFTLALPAPTEEALWVHEKDDPHTSETVGSSPPIGGGAEKATVPQ